MRIRWGPNDTRLYASNDHMGNWFDGIRTRRACICPAAVGTSTITVCSLASIAYRLNQTLKWDPKASHFVDNPAADRLLFRGMRAPWTLTA